jgi:hypothetical protein
MRELVFTVVPDPENNRRDAAVWPDGKPYAWDVPEIMLDLIHFQIARKLLAQGYDPDSLLIINLQGSDRELVRARLGAVAATPLINPEPVIAPAHCVYRSWRQ